MRWLKTESYKIFCPDSLDVDHLKALVCLELFGVPLDHFLHFLLSDLHPVSVSQWRSINYESVVGADIAWRLILRKRCLIVEKQMTRIVGQAGVLFFSSRKLYNQISLCSIIFIFDSFSLKISRQLSFSLCAACDSSPSNSLLLIWKLYLDSYFFSCSS